MQEKVNILTNCTGEKPGNVGQMKENVEKKLLANLNWQLSFMACRSWLFCYVGNLSTNVTSNL
jgi:hypothetical protein